MVRDWPVPSTAKELQTYLGLTNNYRRFIPGYAEIADPFYSLLQKGRKFEWSVDHQVAYDCLKDHLTATPILAYPLPQHSFILDTDASNTSIGAVLSQLQDGQERVISFASRRLSPAQ